MFCMTLQDEKGRLIKCSCSFAFVCCNITLPDERGGGVALIKCSWTYASAGDCRRTLHDESGWFSSSWRYAFVNRWEILSESVKIVSEAQFLNQGE